MHADEKADGHISNHDDDDIEKTDGEQDSNGCSEDTNKTDEVDIRDDENHTVSKEFATSVINRMSDYLTSILELRRILRCARTSERTLPVENRYATRYPRMIVASEVPNEFEPLARFFDAQGDNYSSLDQNTNIEQRQIVVVNVHFSNYLKFAIFLLAVNTIIFFKLLVWDHLVNVQLF